MSERPIYQSQVVPTPFHARTSALCRSGHYARWAGYLTVDVYTNVEEEYFAIRNASTLFDLSPMIKYRIAGPDAARYLDRLTLRNVAKTAPGRVIYTAWCDDDGHVLDDGTLFRFADDEFRLCAQERHLPWLLDSAIGYDVEIAEVTDEVAGLALQGPTSCAVLKALGLSGIADMRPFHFADHDVGGVAVTVSRTGYTGDLGYELWVAPADAERLWDALMEAGRLHGLKPSGSAALDWVRIEAGFIQTNVDFVAAEQALRPTRGRTPFELGLGWMVDFDKGHFNGRRALLRAREAGPRYRVVGLDVEGNKPAHQAFVYHRRDKREVGVVTSAMWSPTCKRNIALATLKAPFAEAADGLWADVYVNKELKWERWRAACRVVDRPFFKPSRRSATPAGDR